MRLMQINIKKWLNCFYIVTAMIAVIRIQTQLKILLMDIKVTKLSVKLTLFLTV